MLNFSQEERLGGRGGGKENRNESISHTCRSSNR